MKKQPAFLSAHGAPGRVLWEVLAPHNHSEEPAQHRSWVLVLLGTAAGICWAHCLTRPCLLLRGCCGTPSH